MPYFWPQMTNLCDFLASMVISHVLIGLMMTRSPSMLIKGARLCQKEVLCTSSIGVQYCGDMVARGPPKHQSNWNFLAFSEPAHQMEPKNASGAMECPHSCNLGHPSLHHWKSHWRSAVYVKLIANSPSI